jgi:vancomycin permeability regulator SanA
MRKDAISLGVDEDKILLDGQGFSTFESISRVKEEYGFDKVVVITQKYHLFRALYIAEKYDIEALGVSADLRTYRGQIYRDLREMLARVKDFIKTQ